MVYAWPTNTLLLRKRNICSGCKHPVHYMCIYFLQTCFEHNHFLAWPTNQALGNNNKPNKGGETILYHKTIKDLQGTWKRLFPWTLADWKELSALFLTLPCTALTSNMRLGFLSLKHYSQPFHNRVTNGIPLPVSSTSNNKTSALLRSQHYFNKTMNMYIIRRATIFIFEDAKVWENIKLLMLSVQLFSVDCWTTDSMLLSANTDYRLRNYSSGQQVIPERISKRSKYSWFCETAAKICLSRSKDLIPDEINEVFLFRWNGQKPWERHI